MRNTKNLYQFEVFNTDTDRTYGNLYNAFDSNEAVLKAYCSENRIFGQLASDFINDNRTNPIVGKTETIFKNFKCSNTGTYKCTYE